MYHHKYLRHKYTVELARRVLAKLVGAKKLTELENKVSNQQKEIEELKAAVEELKKK